MEIPIRIKLKNLIGNILTGNVKPLLQSTASKGLITKATFVALLYVLTASGQEILPPPPINPLNGKPMEVSLEGDFIILKAEGPNKDYLIIDWKLVR